MTIYHVHHIIPRHMDGTDDPSNLIKLTVEEHALAHKKLWEEHGRWEDKLAWQGLAGLIDREELIKQKLSYAGKKGNTLHPGNKGKKYKWKKGYHKPVGTGGLKWYHNPHNPTEKKCIKVNETPPIGWLPGQGKKAINPGLNFHSKKRRITLSPSGQN